MISLSQRVFPSSTWSIKTLSLLSLSKRSAGVLITAWIFLFTSLFHIPVMIYQFPDQAWGAISGSNWLNLAFAAIFPLFIANMLYFISVHRIGPSRSGVYIYLEPVFTVILAFMIRHEHISSGQIIGFLLIIIGVRISKIYSKRIE